MTDTVTYTEDCRGSTVTYSEDRRGRTGRYRVRKGLFGKSILQEYMNYPSLIGGYVDSGVRSFEWIDVSFNHAPSELRVK